MKRLSLLIAVAIIATGSLSAQVFKRQKHELSFHFGTGLSTLQYDLQTGKHKGGFGVQGGAGYAYFFTPDWGIRTGVEIALYQSSARLTNFSDSYDIQGATAADNYTFSYETDNYRETQQALYFNIPLMLQFQSGRTYKLYAAAGAKVGIPISATAKTKKYVMSTKGYFPQEGRTYDDLPQFGFGDYEYLKSSTGLDKLKLHVMLSAEAGLKWKVVKNNDLYAGAFVDYGLDNIQGTKDKRFVTSVYVPRTPTTDKPPMSPLIESQYKGAPFTDKITPLAVGVKLRFTFLQ